MLCNSGLVSILAVLIFVTACLSVSAWGLGNAECARPPPPLNSTSNSNRNREEQFICIANIDKPF